MPRWKQQLASFENYLFIFSHYWIISIEERAFMKISCLTSGITIKMEMLSLTFRPHTDLRQIRPSGLELKNIEPMLGGLITELKS